MNFLPFGQLKSFLKILIEVQYERVFAAWYTLSVLASLGHLSQRERQGVLAFNATLYNNRHSGLSAVPVNCLICPACCSGIFNNTGDYFPGLKESFRLTERLNTRWPGAQSLLSGQK